MFLKEDVRKCQYWQSTDNITEDGSIMHTTILSRMQEATGRSQMVSGIVAKYVLSYWPKARLQASRLTRATLQCNT